MRRFPGRASPQPAAPPECAVANAAPKGGGPKDKVRVLFAYTPMFDGDLTLAEGDEVIVTSRGADGWWVGVHNGVSGRFPGSYVQEDEGDAGAGGGGEDGGGGGGGGQGGGSGGGVGGGGARPDALPWHHRPLHVLGRVLLQMRHPLGPAHLERRVVVVMITVIMVRVVVVMVIMR